jgi:2-haloacid dehalogenase
LLENKKIKMVTLTNGSKDNTLKLLKNSGLKSYISRCFSINELRTWKPDKKTYIYVCKEMNVPPSKTLMIAAHAWDVNGAKKAGLKTGYITRYEKVLSEIYTEPDLVDNNCFSIIKRIKFN